MGAVDGVEPTNNANERVGAACRHLAQALSNVGQMKALAQQYDLPLWMTEFTMRARGTAGLTQDPFAWASLTHDLIATYDVSAVDYLWGFFGQREGNQTTLITLNNSGATYNGYTLNKTYYTTGQFSLAARTRLRTDDRRGCKNPRAYRSLARYLCACWDAFT